MSNTAHVDKLARSIQHWQRNPLDWVLDNFPDDEPTTQQRTAWVELGKLVSAKLKVRDGLKLNEEELKYSRKVGISIMSGQGSGKDWWTARTILWFLANFTDPLIPCTANSAKQLRNVLWAEISRHMDQGRKANPADPASQSFLREMFTWQSERVFFKPKKGESWFAEAVTVNKNASSDEQSSTLAGRHAKHMMIVADEAAGIPNAVFSPLEGTMTDPVNFMVMIFNPIRTQGFAIDSQYKDREKWIALRWNCEESERVSKEHIEYMREKYGVDSAPYRMRVLGLPPLSDSDTLIPMDWIQDALERHFDPDPLAGYRQGLDVGAGGDKSVSIIRNGGKVFPPERNSSPDTGTIARWAVGIRDKYQVNATFVDNIGVGWGVYCYIRNDLGRTSGVYAADSRGKATNPERFHNKRAEMYWRLREAFERGEVDLPDDDDLVNQLACIKYENEGKTQIWKKSKLKTLMDGDSPDEADSLADTYYLPETAFRKTQEQVDAYETEPKETAVGWMGV